MSDLHEQIERAERDVVCADMIDNTERRERELARCRSRLAALRAELEASNDPFNPYGSGPVPTQPRQS